MMKWKPCEGTTFVYVGELKYSKKLKAGSSKGISVYIVG